MTNSTTPTRKQIDAYARHQALKVISVRRVDPAGAARIEAAARAEHERMEQALRAARAAW